MERVNLDDIPNIPMLGEWTGARGRYVLRCRSVIPFGWWMLPKRTSMEGVGGAASNSRTSSCFA